MENRRKFIKGSLLSLGCISAFPLINTKVMAKQCDEELEKLYLIMQKRDIKEKAILFNELVNKYGQEILQIVENNIITQTREVLKIKPIENRNLQAVLDHLWNKTSSTHEFKIVEQTTNKLELSVTRCFFAEEIKKTNAQAIGKAFYCSYDYGFCQGLNPSIVFTRTRTLMDGDEKCNHCYFLT